MESFGQQYSESLISSLSYTLGRTSSAIIDRREVSVKPRGAQSYTPRGAKTIEFTITDSGSYALLNTIRFQSKLRALNPVMGAGQAEPAADVLPLYELALLGPAHAVCFQSCSLKVCGQQVELIDNYAKAYCMMDQLLPTSSKAMDGLQSGALVDAYASASKAVAVLPNVPLTAAQIAGAADIGSLVTDGVQRAFQAAQDAAAQEPAEKDKLIAAATADRIQPLCRCQDGFTDRFIQGPFLFGLLSTGYAMPIPHCPMSITCTLQPEDELVCETLADGSPIPPLNGDGADPTFPILKGRTNRWSLEEPELLMSMITLNSAVTAAFDKKSRQVVLSWSSGRIRL